MMSKRYCGRSLVTKFNWRTAKSFALASVLITLGACGSDSGGSRSTPTPNRPPAASSGWEIGPIIDGRNYSPGAVALSADSFTIPPAPGHLNALTRATGPLSIRNTIRLRYRIDLAEGAAIEPPCCPGSPASLALFIQRRGDNWSARAQYETFRWYSTSHFISPLEAGEHELIVPLSGRWTAVLTSASDTSPAAFREALANAARIGIVFGGGTGWAHGASATGEARFTILEWSVQ